MQDPSHVCNLHLSSQQHWNPNVIPMWGQGSNLHLHGYQSHLSLLHHNGTSTFSTFWNVLLYTCTIFTCFIFLFFFFLSFFYFLDRSPSTWRFPGYGSNRSRSHRPTPEPQQRGIQGPSATYTTAHGNTGSLTHWARPGIQPATSWFLIRFANHWAMTGTPYIYMF